jgi:hypothetical protein
MYLDWLGELPELVTGRPYAGELLVEMCWIYWVGCRPVYRHC